MICLRLLTTMALKKTRTMLPGLYGNKEYHPNCVTSVIILSIVAAAAGLALKLLILKSWNYLLSGCENINIIVKCACHKFLVSLCLIVICWYSSCKQFLTSFLKEIINWRCSFLPLFLHLMAFSNPGKQFITHWKAVKSIWSFEGEKSQNISLQPSVHI